MPDRAPAPARLRTIALDGPVASGKTTVGRLLAERLGFLCFDTGLLYRALTVLALREGIAPGDASRLAELVRARPIGVEPRPASRLGCAVSAGGADLTDDLHRPEVDAAVSEVSRHGEVRDALLSAQRRVAATSAAGVVMLGRDIGTVVLPDADLKVYLDASAPARARRRFRERLARGEPAVYAEVFAGTLARDARDAGRAIAPLAAAPDAVVVDTDRCDARAVVDHLAALAARWPDALTTGGGDAPCRPPGAGGGLRSAAP